MAISNLIPIHLDWNRIGPNPSMCACVCIYALYIKNKNEKMNIGVVMLPNQLAPNNDIVFPCQAGLQRPAQSNEAHAAKPKTHPTPPHGFKGP